MEDSIQHYGVKGMKWGIRRDPQSKEVSNRLKSYRSTKNDPKTDFLGLNRPNSAARTYYRSQRTSNFTEYKRQSAILDKKISGLSKEQIENGRYRVAHARNIKRKTASTLIGVGTGLATVSTIGPAAVPVSVAVGVGANFITGGHYYQSQSATYGSRRARREINGNA